MVTWHTLPDGRKLWKRADSYQLLLNCALTRSAAMGLDYFILPRVGFYFGRGLVTFMCPFKVDPGTEAKIPPVVWHSAGFSTNYVFETQVLLDLNWTDLDASGGHCAAGQRGSWEAFVNPLMARRQLCDHVRAKGIQAHMLYSGSGRATVAEEWLAFLSGWMERWLPNLCHTVRSWFGTDARELTRSPFFAVWLLATLTFLEVNKQI